MGEGVSNNGKVKVSRLQSEGRLLKFKIISKIYFKIINSHFVLFETVKNKYFSLTF